VRNFVAGSNGKQRMLRQNGGKYVITGTGQNYFNSYERFKKIR